MALQSWQISRARSIDEMFKRSDSSGTYTPLQDALGSTIALVDASGNIVTTYAYDPFGNTTVDGLSNSNVFQYTGRENEGFGLYFYRARYYSPVLGRFVNEDPVGYGENFYAYANNDPINYSDAFGLWPGSDSAAPAAAPSPKPQFVVIEGGKSAAGATSGGFFPNGAGEWGIAGLLVTIDGGLAYEDYEGIKTYFDTNAAYAEEMNAIKAMNAVLLAKKKPFRFAPFPLPKVTPETAYGNPYPLAGRYTGAMIEAQTIVPSIGGMPEEYCAGVGAIPRSSPEWENYSEIWGSSYDRCVRGQVPQRCGGNRVE